MDIVLLSAVGVGGATMFGAIIGFLFRGVTRRVSGAVMSFAAGVSIGAAVLGLVLPSIEYGGKFGAFITVTGIFFGALTVNLLNLVTPYAERILCVKSERVGARTDRVLVFVMAMAIHNLPEGIAAGVGFGGGDISAGIFIAIGIAIQNIPEGMVIIVPMINAGVSPGRTLVCALATGVVEVIGTFIGFFAVTLAEAILPFSLAFAGGTMLYVVSEDMIPEAHTGGGASLSGYALVLGFCLMLIFSVVM